MQRQGGILSLLLVVAVSAFGQVSSSIFSTGPDGTRGSATFHVPEYLPRAVVGAPYYGEEVTERVQTLPNGVHITHTDIRQKTWRDSQGRTRTERPMMMGPHLPDAPTVVQITDPVAGYIYTLDTEKKVAHRVAVQQRPERSPSNSPAVTGRAGVRTMLRGAPASGAEQKSDTQRPEVTNEALGTKTIDGVAVEGTRITMTYPTGSQDNDGPFSTIAETWRSKELDLILLSTRDDPRQGITTQKIANLSTQEPDPTLFMLPAGYTIADETGSFSITWGNQ